MHEFSILDLQTVGSVQRQPMQTHSSSIEGQLLTQAKWELWLKLTFAQVIMGYYNSHLTSALHPWKPSCLMAWSEGSEYTSRNMLLLPVSAVVPPVTHWQQHPSMSPRHVSHLPLHFYSCSSPGDLLCFLSLRATKLDPGTLQGIPQSVPYTVWYAVTLRMCQSQWSLGWETEANFWMVVLKKEYKEIGCQGCPSACNGHLIAKTGWLCGLCPCFTPGDRAPHFPTSLPDPTLRRRGYVLLSCCSVTSSVSWEVV